MLTKAEAILKELASFTTYEDQYAFVECASFADSIKMRGWRDQAHWHFVDTPFYDGISEVIPGNDYNITWEIEQLKEALHYSEAGSDTGFTGVSYALADSFNLRLLIHYIGDIHQPLHATTRYTEAMPQGDRGGNSFTLEKHGEIDELHALWDSGLEQYKTDYSLPLTEYHWNKLTEFSSTLRTAYPMSTFDDVNTFSLKEYVKWSDESYELSKTFVYNGVTEGGWPSDQYFVDGKVIVNKQLAKGGYRLANLLVTIWGSSSEMSQ